MRNKTILVLLVFLGGFNTLNCQDMKALQEIYLESEYFFLTGEYSDAVPGYLQINEKLPSNSNVSYRIGVCYLNIPGKKNLSIKYLEAAAEKMSRRYREGKLSHDAAPYDALFQLGIAYRIDKQFEKAKNSFERYRKTLTKNNKEDISFIDHEITICDKAQNLISKPVLFSAENLGSGINGVSDEFNPVMSADGNTLAYMRKLPFYDAIMVSARSDKGGWSAPRNIIEEIGVDGDLSISSLSSDGKMLFLSLDDNSNSDILITTFDGTRWSKAKKLGESINTKYWESHGFISEDGLQLFFSSDRPGGSGGLDLYASRWENGGWGLPVNLGPEINTSLNEDRPSVLKGGTILFFSSQGHDNMGGYDIFRARIDDTGKWGKPQNMGYPFNTTDDDTFFMPVDGGRAGYVSVFREGEGFGQNDLYLIIFK